MMSKSDSSAEETEHYSELLIHDYNFKFQVDWKVSNFSHNFINNQSFEIKSPNFKSESIQILKNNLNLKLRFDSKTGFFSLYFHAEVEKSVKATVKYQLSNISGNVFQKGNFSQVYEWVRCLSLKQLIEKKKILNNKSVKLHDDILIINISVIFHAPSTNSESESHFSSIELMATDFEKFYEKESLCDITIVIGNESLEAHKSVLAARSSVFLAMFSSNMMENNESKIVITDISYDTMREVLYFIYSGKVRNLEKYKRPLLIAADKYDIQSLKKICEKSFVKNLNQENYCETLKIAQLCGDCNDLRTALLYVIHKHPDIVKSEEFKRITDTDPQFLRDIILF